MSATIKGIAQIAGVSRGTVDRVLNNRGGVNNETASRVMAIASELDYKPNLAAKSLSEKGTQGGRAIGVMVSADGNPFYDEVLAGIAAKGSEIEDFGFRILLSTLGGYDINRQLQVIDSLIDAGAGGLILTPINRPPLTEKLRRLNERGFPVVCLNTDVDDAPRVAYIGSDYKQCGRVAAGMFGLLSDGKPQKLGVVIGSFMVLGHDLRVQGFRECIESEFPNIEIAAVVENNDNDEASYRLTRSLLSQNPDLTGIFFGAAGIEGGLRAVADFGKLGQLKILCVDLIDAVKQGLKDGSVAATICQEPYMQGYEAVRVMFDLLLAGRRPASDIHIENRIIIKHNL